MQGDGTPKDENGFRALALSLIPPPCGCEDATRFQEILCEDARPA